MRVERSDGRRYLIQYLAELDRGRESPDYLLRKLLGYHRWFVTTGADWLDRLYRRHGFPASRLVFRLAVVVSGRRRGSDDLARLARVFVQALKLPPATGHKILFTTRELLDADRANVTPHAAALYFATRQFKQAWLAEIAEDLYAAGKQKAVYDYVTDKLRTLGPAYTLLPPPR